MMTFTTGRPEPTFTIARRQTYTDAYGATQEETVRVHVPITRHVSRAMLQPITDTRADYLTRLGCVVAMLQCLKHYRTHGEPYQAKRAAHYRNAATDGAPIETRARIITLWNMATLARPFIP
jgi:hypothetical protein